MARGPRGEMRPDDPAQAAVMAVRVGLGEIDDKADVQVPKNAAAVARGQLGGKRGGIARAEALSSEERKNIARMAASARWKKDV